MPFSGSTAHEKNELVITLHPLHLQPVFTLTVETKEERVTSPFLCGESVKVWNYPSK